MTGDGFLMRFATGVIPTDIMCTTGLIGDIEIILIGTGMAPMANEIIGTTMVTRGSGTDRIATTIIRIANETINISRMIVSMTGHIQGITEMAEKVDK